LRPLNASGFNAGATCVIGETIQHHTYIVHVSLIGSGTTVNAVWAAMMDRKPHLCELEGVGSVQLWQKRPELADLGYRIAWRRRHKVVQIEHGMKIVHLVTEPEILLVADPLAADLQRRRRRGEEVEVALPDETAKLSDAAEEQIARETRPLFVLLQRRDESMESLMQRHLLWLSYRIQWMPYYEPWARSLWDSALATGEARPLTVWATVPDTETPLIVDAWYCAPQPLTLGADLPQLVGALPRNESDTAARPAERSCPCPD
jgi:hypothetical protein